MQIPPGVCLSFPSERRVAHISLVFREMWDSTAVDREVLRMNRESEGKSSGIPHLAKNERDVGHPSLLAVWRIPLELTFAQKIEEVPSRSAGPARTKLKPVGNLLRAESVIGA
jgi:hypothetical protein